MSALANHIPRTLIADDQPDVLVALRLLLKGAGYQTESANSPQAVLEAINTREFDVALIDLNYARDTTSGQEGLDLMSRIQLEDKTLPIVVMTAWGTVDLAVEAMRRGVRDFVQKPWENSRLLQVLRAQVEQGRTRRQRASRVSQRRARRANFQQQLREAKQIQHRLMRVNKVRLDGFELASSWRAAGSIGGDCLAAIPLGEHHAALCIADASGKGLPAALMMSNLQAALKSIASEKISAAGTCAHLNQFLHGHIPANRFVTCFYGLVDARRHVLRFTNAGHNPPLLVRQDGELLRLETGGRVLGAFAASIYTEAEVSLRRGDRLLLFTDGLTEARNSAGEEFGEARLQELVQREARRNARELQKIIMDRMTWFCSGQFSDDAALMILEVK